MLQNKREASRQTVCFQFPGFIFDVNFPEVKGYDSYRTASVMPSNLTIPKRITTPAKNDFGNYGAAATDAIWTLYASFLIFTMQSGFGILESGKP